MGSIKAKKMIFFRASGIAALMSENRATSITDKQLETIKFLESKPKLTEKQSEELDRLIAKRDAPPELSKTAKDYIKNVWLLNNKGYYDELENVAVKKGLFNEEDALDLLTKVTGRFYLKNTTRIHKNNITGECDIQFEEDGRKIIEDAKCSWSAKTFIQADLKSVYEWQGIAYMYLYDADEFRLRYCLTDCPAHLYESEVWKLKNRYGIIDPDDESVKPLFDQLKRNLIYSDNADYSIEERVKTFVIKRDKQKEEALLSKIPQAIEYYNSLSLNSTH